MGKHKVAEARDQGIKDPVAVILWVCQVVRAAMQNLKRNRPEYTTEELDTNIMDLLYAQGEKARELTGTDRETRRRLDRELHWLRNLSDKLAVDRRAALRILRYIYRPGDTDCKGIMAAVIGEFALRHTETFFHFLYIDEVYLQYLETDIAVHVVLGALSGLETAAIDQLYELKQKKFQHGTPPEMWRVVGKQLEAHPRFQQIVEPIMRDCYNYSTAYPLRDRQIVVLKNKQEMSVSTAFYKLFNAMYVEVEEYNASFLSVAEKVHPIAQSMFDLSKECWEEIMEFGRFALPEGGVKVIHRLPPVAKMCGVTQLWMEEGTEEGELVRGYVVINQLKLFYSLCVAGGRCVIRGFPWQLHPLIVLVLDTLIVSFCRDFRLSQEDSLATNTEIMREKKQSAGAGKHPGKQPDVIRRYIRPTERHPKQGEHTHFVARRRDYKPCAPYATQMHLSIRNDKQCKANKKHLEDVAAALPSILSFNGESLIRRRTGEVVATAGGAITARLNRCVSADPRRVEYVYSMGSARLEMIWQEHTAAKAAPKAQPENV